MDAMISFNEARGTASRNSSFSRVGGGQLRVALAAVLAACGGAGAPSGGAATAGDPQPPAQLRDVRYCEVIPSVANGATITTSIYNTLGYNACPPVQWTALTEDQVNQAFGSQSAKLNGPRHWMLDRIQASGSSTTGATFAFGGITMGLRATLTTPAGQPTVGNQFYVPNDVQRDTVWVYDAGKPIFELVDPQGNAYVMQSYAQIADRTLTIEQLPDLAHKLALPPGWSYRTETPSSELDLASNGLATVVNDNLYNSYQQRR
jgi:hypothetical protein